MQDKRKIDEEGKLLSKEYLDNSKFFILLSKNNDKDIDEWLLNNGKKKPYCPIRFTKNVDAI